MHYGNILVLYLRLYHCFWVLIIEMLKCSDVLWYRDTFGVMHRYSCTLYRPISRCYNPQCASSHLMRASASLHHFIIKGVNTILVYCVTP